MTENNVSIIGYSGHSFVCLDIMCLRGYAIHGYYDKIKKLINPYNLKFLGSEDNSSIEEKLFISIGDNAIRNKIYSNLRKLKLNIDFNLIHPSAIISKSVDLESQILVCANAVINPMARIKKGVIINTSSVVEHECIIGDFSHIAPSATLCGNVKIGKRCLIGANSTILPNLKIGDDVVIGAGTTITKNIESNSIVYDNFKNKIK